MKLFKRQDRYDLYADDGQKLGSTANGKLSQSNCDELFGVVDVEKLAELDYRIGLEEYIPTPATHIQSFKSGFNKAMELNKDKVFGVKEVVELCKILLSNPFEKCGKTYQELTDNYIQSLQQPTEIEVAVEYMFSVEENGESTNTGLPKLDENGNLILRKL